MKFPVASVACALLGTAFAAQAHAQAAAAPTPPVPLYQVEIIVFANRDFDSTEERFPQALAPLGTDQNESLPELPLFVEASPPSTPEPAIAAEPEPGLPPSPPVEDPLAFRLLAPEELQLNTEYRKLTSLGAYRPLLHAGWIQPGLPEDQTRPVDLTLFGVSNPNGKVSVYLSRFLHVSIDMTYQDGAVAAEAPALGGDLHEITLAPRYRLITERQARSGELHYFDHPAFGILVKVTPVPTGNNNSASRRPAA